LEQILRIVYFLIIPGKDFCRERFLLFKWIIHNLIILDPSRYITGIITLAVNWLDCHDQVLLWKTQSEHCAIQFMVSERLIFQRKLPYQEEIISKWSFSQVLFKDWGPKTQISVNNWRRYQYRTETFSNSIATKIKYRDIHLLKIIWNTVEV